MWCWRRMEKISWTDHVRNEGGIEVTGRQGRRRRKLLDDLKERRGYSHFNPSTTAFYNELLKKR